jgi:hypothetical protein
MENYDDLEATQRVEARRAVEQGKRIALAERIAAGWAEHLKPGKAVVAWVAGQRREIHAAAGHIPVTTATPRLVAYFP